MSILHRKVSQQYIRNKVGFSLVNILYTPDFKGYAITKSGQPYCMEGTEIVETPSGLIIMGDTCPKLGGVISPRSYSLNWLAGATCEFYLAEKFLAKSWYSELAVEEFTSVDFWKNYFGDEDQKPKQSQIAGLEQIIRELQGGESTMESLRDDLDYIGLNFDEDFPGWGYNPNELGLLVGIQSVFSVLYRELLNANKQQTVSANDGSTPPVA